MGKPPGDWVPSTSPVCDWVCPAFALCVPVAVRQSRSDAGGQQARPWGEAPREPRAHRPCRWCTA